MLDKYESDCLQICAIYIKKIYEQQIDIKLLLKEIIKEIKNENQKRY